MPYMEVIARLRESKSPTRAHTARKEEKGRPGTLGWAETSSLGLLHCRQDPELGRRAPWAESRSLRAPGWLLLGLKDKTPSAELATEYPNGLSQETPRFGSNGHGSDF